MNEFELRKAFTQATPSEYLRVFEAALRHWPDLRMAMTVPGEPNMPFPARSRYGESCILASNFADNRFLGFDARILAEMKAVGHANNIQWRFETLLDANAISFIASWMGGKDSDRISDIVDFLVAAKGNKFNWNIGPFVLENTRLLNVPKYEQLLASALLAHEQLEDLDVPHLLATRKARFVDEESGRIRAQQQMATWRENARLFGDTSPMSLCDEAYIFLLKIAGIQLENPSPSLAQTKMCRLLEFLDDTIGQIRFLIVWTAWELFSKHQSKIYYFRNVTQPGQHLQAVLRNMAWDLMLVIQQHEFLADRIDPADFFKIPYVLTCDKGVHWLLSLEQYRAVVLSDRLEYPLTCSSISREVRLKTICDDKTLERFFGEKSKLRRHAAKRGLNQAEAQLLIAKLEDDVGIRPAATRIPSNISTSSSSSG